MTDTSSTTYYTYLCGLTPATEYYFTLQACANNVCSEVEYSSLMETRKYQEHCKCIDCLYVRL